MNGKYLVGAVILHMICIFVGEMITDGSSQYIRIEEATIASQEPATITILQERPSVFAHEGVKLYLASDPTLYCVTHVEPVSGGVQLDLRGKSCKEQDVEPTLMTANSPTKAATEIARNVEGARDLTYEPQPINITGANIVSTPWFFLGVIESTFATISQAVTLDYPFLHGVPMVYLRTILLGAYGVIVGLWILPLALQAIGGLVGRLGRFVGLGG